MFEISDVLLNIIFACTNYMKLDLVPFFCPQVPTCKESQENNGQFFNSKKVSEL